MRKSECTEVVVGTKTGRKVESASRIREKTKMSGRRTREEETATRSRPRCEAVYQLSIRVQAHVHRGFLILDQTRLLRRRPDLAAGEALVNARDAP